MKNRQIDKNPKPPTLPLTAIKLLTTLCFRKDCQGKSDAIFEFSTFVDEGLVAKKVQELLNLKISNTVILTGGNSAYGDEKPIDKTEADLVGDLIPRQEYPDVTFIYERSSNSLLDNIEKAAKVYDFSKCKSLTFITKAHATGRSYLSLKTALPSDAKLYQSTYPATYPEHNEALTAESWHKSNFGRSRIWGEYLRIKTYGERGDIPLKEVQDLITAIENETV